MSEQRDEMYVSRVLFKNGTTFNFLFSDPGRCKSCTEALAEGKMRFAENKPARDHQVHVFDDAGREAYIDGSQIEVCMSVVAGYEVHMNTRLDIYIKRLSAHLYQLAGEPMGSEPGAGQRQPEPEQPSGVIGRKIEFAG